MWIGKNTEVSLFTELGYKGRQKTFAEDFKCLSTCDTWKANKALSASVFIVTKSRVVLSVDEIKKLEKKEKKEEERQRFESSDEFFSIVYGSYGNLDVTEKIKTYVHQENHSLTFSAFKDSFGETMKDTAQKTSHLFYMAIGEICVACSKDNEVLSVSAASGGVCYKLNYTKENFKVYAAAFGGKDVTKILRDFGADPNFRTLEANPQFYLPDPLPGYKKTLSVYYELDGKQNKITIIEGDKVDVTAQAQKLIEAEIARKKAEEERLKKLEEERLAAEAAKKAAEELKRKQEERERQRLEALKKKFSVIDAEYSGILVTDQFPFVKESGKRGCTFKILPSPPFPKLTPGYFNQATIFHWSNGKVCFSTVTGDKSVDLDENSDNIENCHDEPATNTDVRIFLATFGGFDVTPVLRERSKDKSFTSVTSLKSEFGNILPGWQNVLFIHYAVGNSLLTKIVLEGQKIVFIEEIEKAKIEKELQEQKIQQAIEDAKKEKENEKYKFSIVGVNWGGQDSTNYVNNNVTFVDNVATIDPSSAYFGDPLPGVTKALQVFYWSNMKICVESKLEKGKAILLSKVKKEFSDCWDPPKDENQINVYAAAYGVKDVTKYMRYGLADENKVTTYTPQKEHFLEPKEYNDGLVVRSFSIFFKINGYFFYKIAKDGETIDFVRILQNYLIINKPKINEKPNIIAAHYGDLETTDRVGKIVLLSPTSKVTFIGSGINFGDPNPLKIKTNGILYTMNNKYCAVAGLEKDILTLEESPKKCYTSPDPKSTVRIYAATYSGEDVTEILRKKALNSEFKGLSVNDVDIIAKSKLDDNYARGLLIYYELDDQFYINYYDYGSTLNFKNAEDIRREAEIANKTYFTITHASYGPTDFTDKVKEMVDQKEYSLKFISENSQFGDTWEDNSPKYSHVFYIKHGQHCVANAREFTAIDIGVKNHNPNCHPKPGNTKIKIDAASWGDRDVTEFLRAKTEDPKFNTIFAEDSFFGGPLKTLSIQFEIEGRKYRRIIREHEVIDLVGTDLDSQQQVIAQTSANADLKSNIVSTEAAEKMKAYLILKQNQVDKLKAELLLAKQKAERKLEEEKQRAILANLKESTLRATSDITTATILSNQSFINDVWIKDIKFNTKLGTTVKNGALVKLINIKSRRELYFGSGNNGLTGISGANLSFTGPEANFKLTTVNNELKQLDSFQLESSTGKPLKICVSTKVSINKESSEREVLATNELTDEECEWKFTTFLNYGVDLAIKVGDIVRIENLKSQTLLNSNSKIAPDTKAYSQIFVKEKGEPDYDLWFVDVVASSPPKVSNRANKLQSKNAASVKLTKLKKKDSDKLKEN